MAPLIVWFRTQLIFWLFIPLSVMTLVDKEAAAMFCLFTAIFGVVFGLPGILGNYLYIGILKRLKISKQYMLGCMLLGLPLIMLGCIYLMFFCFSGSSREVWQMFGDLSAIVIAVVIATVLSTFSCYRLLFNYIYPAQNDKTV